MKRTIEILSPAEMIQLANHAGSGKTGARNRAMIAFMSATGLRVREVCGIIASNLDLEKCTVTVPAECAKLHKPRTVAFDPSLRPLISDWLTIRRGLGLTNSQPLFPAVSTRGLGNPLAPRQVHRMLADTAKRAGIEKRIHPHGFRHSAACYWLENGVDLRVIQKQLGHSSIAVTARYLDHLSDKAQREAIAAIPSLGF